MRQGYNSYTCNISVETQKFRCDLPSYDSDVLMYDFSLSSWNHWTRKDLCSESTNRYSPVFAGV